MASGGYRPGAGRPIGTTKNSSIVKREPKKSKKIVASEKINLDKKDWKTPLEYMMSVLNDSSVDESRRDRLAIAAAPFVHARAGEGGKKDERQAAAKKASSGKFSPVAPPLRLVK